MIGKLRTLAGILKEDNRNLRQVYQLLVADQIEKLREEARRRDPLSLVPFGYKMYSQSDEDGMIREIFNRIGTTNKVFVEFGVGNGLENNTRALLFEQWRGLWIEACPESVKAMVENMPRTLGSGRLKIVESFVTRDTIDQIIAANVPEREIDLLSVDIDGNDYHVLEAIACVRPRVIVVEYNAKFVPPVVYCMKYAERHAWSQDDFVGSSLKFLELRLAERGYRLVGCNLIGANAFFVRDELAADRFLQPSTAERHYQPARYYLTFGVSPGHPPSYATLEEAL